MKLTIEIDLTESPSDESIIESIKNSLTLVQAMRDTNEKIGGTKDDICGVWSDGVTSNTLSK